MKQWFERMAGRLAKVFLSPGVVSNSDNFEFWERKGVHVTPVHFYQPVPDTRQLHSAYPQRSLCGGVDLRTAQQVELLRDLAGRFSAEYNQLPRERSEGFLSFIDNDAFNGVDPYVYYAFIRWLKPRRIVEVGSGHSTLLAADVLSRGGDFKLTVVDPWPRYFVDEIVARRADAISLIRQPVESRDIQLFGQLEENDILFIDTSHVVRTGGDVNFLFLEVIPSLKPGVVVHVHDIYMPYEYPEDVVLRQRMFFTEQYLLQAYLSGNPHAEVLLAVHQMCRDFPEAIRSAFPRASRFGGGSFWFRHL